MVRKLASIGISLLLLSLWIAVFYSWTDGFNAFTTYTHTLRTAGPLPRPLPPFTAIDEEGRSLELPEGERGKYLLIDFIFLHCGTVCPILTSRFQEIYEGMKEVIPGKLVLLSISFDIDRDRPEDLKEFREHVGAGEGWSFAIPRISKEELSNLLQKIGIFVYRRPDGLFNHSTYLFLVDPGGEIVRVLDPGRETTPRMIEEIRGDLR